MACEPGRPTPPLRIDTTGMTKEEMAEVVGIVFRVRSDLKDKGLALTFKRKRPAPKLKSV